MSLTSYRAAPPRVTIGADVFSPEACLFSVPTAPDWTAGCSTPRAALLRSFGTRRGPARALFWGTVVPFVIVMGFYRHAGFNAWRRPTLPTLER